MQQMSRGPLMGFQSKNFDSIFRRNCIIATEWDTANKEQLNIWIERELSIRFIWDRKIFIQVDKMTRIQLNWRIQISMLQIDSIKRRCRISGREWPWSWRWPLRPGQRSPSPFSFDSDSGRRRARSRCSFLWQQPLWVFWYSLAWQLRASSWQLTSCFLRPRPGRTLRWILRHHRRQPIWFGSSLILAINLNWFLFLGWDNWWSTGP